MVFCGMDLRSATENVVDRPSTVTVRFVEGVAAGLFICMLPIPLELSCERAGRELAASEQISNVETAKPRVLILFTSACSIASYT